MSAGDTPSATPRESVYDAEISPLVAEILKICKREPVRGQGGDMSPEELGRAYVACPGWEWFAGMNDYAEGIITSVGPLGYPWLGRIKLLFALPDVEHPQTLAIIAYVLLPNAWPGHSVQVETFPDGTAEIVVKCSEGWGRMKVQRGPVAVSLLRCLEASP